VEVETRRKLKALRTDRGGEFTSTEFGQYYAEHGIHRQLTAPYSPQQNGVVERRNQSIVVMACCMLKAKHLPGYFWGEAVCTAVHILNRAPTRVLDGRTRTRRGMESGRLCTTSARSAVLRMSRTLAPG
jgi:hypothetical protein